MVLLASDGERYCWRSALWMIRYHIAYIYLGVTLHFRIVSIIQFTKHDLERLDRFTIPLLFMQSCMHQLVSKVRRRVEFGDLCAIRMSLGGYEPIDDVVPL